MKHIEGQQLRCTWGLKSLSDKVSLNTKADRQASNKLSPSGARYAYVVYCSRDIRKVGKVDVCLLVEAPYKLQAHCEHKSALNH